MQSLKTVSIFILLWYETIVGKAQLNIMCTWMGGSKTARQPGNYGTFGVESNTSYPGARYEHDMMFDPNLGVIYVFGGLDTDSSWMTFLRLESR